LAWRPIILPRALRGSTFKGGVTMSKISIAGLDKAEVLAALYNAARPQGLGFLHYDPAPMTREEAEALLRQTAYFDYVRGRVLKVDLSGDEFDSSLYDRDNGQDAAERVIAALRATGNNNAPTIQTMHATSTLRSAEETRRYLSEESRREERGGVTIFHLGLSDVADKLGPAVDNAVRKLREAIRRLRK